MTKTKMLNKFCYCGLGFPIELENVETILINGEWVPKIDVHEISDRVIKELATQASRLTGNQVKFIRSYFSMPLREFGEKVVHETHAAVRKWELKGDDITAMNENTEQVLRLFIIEKTQTKTRREQADFYDKFQKSKSFFNVEGNQHHLIHINLCA